LLLIEVSESIEKEDGNLGLLLCEIRSEVDFIPSSRLDTKRLKTSSESFMLEAKIWMRSKEESFLDRIGTEIARRVCVERGECRREVS